MEKVIVPSEHRPKSRDEFLAACRPDELVYLRKTAQERPPSLSDKAVHALFRHRFAGAREAQAVVSPLPLDIPLSPEKDLQRAVAMLQAAQRPVIVLGSQSTCRPGLANDLASAV